MNPLRTLAPKPAVRPAQIGEMLTTFREDADTMLVAVHEALAGVSSSTTRAPPFWPARAGSGLDELLEQLWCALQAEFADALRSLIPQ